MVGEICICEDYEGNREVEVGVETGGEGGERDLKKKGSEKGGECWIMGITEKRKNTAELPPHFQGG